MATQKQIEANSRNSARSTGPTSDEGKSRSRANATRHGLAGGSADAIAVPGAAEEFAERRALWAAQYRPADPGAEFALDRAVAASLRIERCQRALDDLTASASGRAKLAWDEDQAIEAATIAGRLAKDPVLASRQLRATLAGVGLLIESWVGLGAAFEGGADWSESERSKALDLLGVAPDLRAHRTRIDPPADFDPLAYRRSLVMGEVERLERLRERAMIPLDVIERERMIDGDVALVTKSAKLVMRYERDAWRQYREALKVLQAPNRDAETPTGPVAMLPPPLTFGPPARVEPAKPRAPEPARMAPVGLEAEPDWLAEIEKRIGPEAMNARRARVVASLAEFAVGRADPVQGEARVTDRTQFAGHPTGIGAGWRPIG